MTPPSSRPRQRLRLVRQTLAAPDLRRLLAAFAIFTLGEWATWIALLVYAHGEGGTGASGIAAVVMLIPAAVLSPPAAAIIDRIPRRSGLIVGYGTQAVFATATGAMMLLDLPMGAVLVAAAIFTVSVSACRIAHGSAIPLLSREPREAMATTALGGSLDGWGGLVGPLIAAALLVAGPGFLFVFIGALLFVATLTVGRLEGGRSTVVPDSRATEEATASTTTTGLADLGSVIAIGGLAQVALGAIDILLVVLAIEVLGLGEPGAGLLNALFGIGSVGAGLAAVGLIGRPRLSRAIGTGAAGMGIPLVLAAQFSIATLLFPLAGFGRTYGDIAGRTLLHRLAPDHAMGRAFGVLEALSMAGLAVGAGLTPLLIESMGITGALMAIGSVMPVGFAVLWPLIRHADRRARVPAQALEILASVPEFALLEPTQLEQLALDAELQATTPGEAIMREGDEGSSAWVVAGGMFRVSKQGAAVADLAPGSLVGEIALLRSVPRTAEVTSIDHGTLLRLDRSAFLHMITAGSPHGHHLHQTAAHRLEELEAFDD